MKKPSNTPARSVLTPSEAREKLEFQGISVAQWARENGYAEHYSLVSEVLAGRKKCRYGTSHNIAVALGIKAGVVTTRPGRVAKGAAA